MSSNTKVVNLTKDADTTKVTEVVKAKETATKKEKAMPKRNTVPVTAADVRNAFRTKALDASKVLDKDGNPVPTTSLFGPKGDGKVRGRVDQRFVDAYLAAHPEASYTAKAGQAENTVTLEMRKPDSAGRFRKYTEDVPVSTVRRLSKTDGKRGRLSADAIKAATEAITRQRGWVKPKPSA